MRLKHILAIPVVGGIITTIVYFSAFYNRNKSTNQNTFSPSVRYIEIETEEPTESPSFEPTELN